MAAEKIQRMIPYVAITTVCVYFYALADKFRFAARPGQLGPGFWPKLMLALTMAVCVYEVIRIAFFTKTPPPPPADPGSAAECTEEAKRYPGHLVVGTLLTVAYVYCVPYAGFVICTFVYFILFMIVGRYRNLWVVLANGIIGTLVLVFIFMKVVYVSLPLGQEPFAQVTFFVMRLLGIK